MGRSEKGNMMGEIKTGWEEEETERMLQHVALKLPTMHLTNSVTFKFNGKDYFATLMQR